MRSMILKAILLVSAIAAATAVVTMLAGPGWTNFPAAPAADVSATGDPVVLIIDEDSIDNGTSTIEQISFNSPNCGAGDPATCVNDDIVRDAGNGLTTPLFSRGTDITPFSGLVLPTGQLQDEGLFFVGLSGSALESFILDTLPNSQLDPIPGSPLGEAEIRALEGRVVCAKVKDSDVSDLGGGLLNAQGDYMGLTAFEVVEVLGPGTIPESMSSSSLPDIRVNLLPSGDVIEACLAPKVAPTATPVPPTATPVSEVSPTIVMPSPTPPKEKGDVNCDGVVTIEDAQLIGQLLLGMIDELPCPDQADVNKDGRVTINDAQLIAQLVLGTIPDFGY